MARQLSKIWNGFIEWSGKNLQKYDPTREATKHSTTNHRNRLERVLAEIIRVWIDEANYLSTFNPLHPTRGKGNRIYLTFEVS